MEGYVAMMVGREHKGAVKQRRASGAQGFYWNDGPTKEYVQRPPVLAGVENAYALYVDGTSMEPRYCAGQLLYVNPNQPVIPKSFVAIQLPDGRGIIGQFLGTETDGFIGAMQTKVVICQLNPAKTIKIPRGNVKQMHRIVGTAE